MEYEDARRYLFQLQAGQVAMTKNQGRGKGHRTKVDLAVRRLLKELTGEAPTEEQVLGATYR
jgi:hypothetical protein